MDEETRDIGGTPSESAAQPSAIDSAMSDIVSDSRADVEESVRDEGRDESAVMIDAITRVLTDRLAPIEQRLTDIERAQRDTFATMVRDGGIVQSRTVTEVDNAPAQSIADYDLSI